jgi:hypothetical protein
MVHLIWILFFGLIFKNLKLIGQPIKSVYYKIFIQRFFIILLNIILKIKIMLTIKIQIFQRFFIMLLKFTLIIQKESKIILY